MTVLLSAKGLHKSFGGVRAVRDVSFDVRAGSVFAIIGPNGAGKSTMLNLISGVYQADAGTLSFNGADLAGLPAHRRVRRGIARTFQKIRLFKQLSVLENVVAGFHIHHDIPAWQYLVHGSAFQRDHARCRADAMELLSFMGLARKARRARRLAPLRRAAHAGVRPRPCDQAEALPRRRAGRRTQRRRSGHPARSHPHHATSAASRWFWSSTTWNW